GPGPHRDHRAAGPRRPAAAGTDTVANAVRDRRLRRRGPRPGRRGPGPAQPVREGTAQGQRGRRDCVADRHRPVAAPPAQRPQRSPPAGLPVHAVHISRVPPAGAPPRLPAATNPPPPGRPPSHATRNRRGPPSVKRSTTPIILRELG